MYFTNTCMFNTCGSDCTTKVHTTAHKMYSSSSTSHVLTYYPYCAHMSCHVGTQVVCHVCTTVLLNYYLLLATILLVLTLLTRRPCHLSTTQNMKVQVIDTLTPQRPIIHNNSITFVQILHVGYFRSSYHKFS